MSQRGRKKKIKKIQGPGAAFSSCPTPPGHRCSEQAAALSCKWQGTGTPRGTPAPGPPAKDAPLRWDWGCWGEKAERGDPSLDVTPVKSQLSAPGPAEIRVQLNKKYYLISQACRLAVKLKALQTYVNIAALPERCFMELVVLLRHVRAVPG